MASPRHNHHKAASLINAIIDRVSNILSSSEVYAAATVKQMLQGKQYGRAIRGVRLTDEALSQMFLTSAEAFAFKNSLPWLTNETKHLV